MWICHEIFRHGAENWRNWWELFERMDVAQRKTLCGSVVECVSPYGIGADFSKCKENCHLSISRITALGWKSVSPSRARRYVFSSEMNFLLWSLSWWGNTKLSPFMENKLVVLGFISRWMKETEKQNQLPANWRLAGSWFCYPWWLKHLQASQKGSWPCSLSIQEDNTDTWSERQIQFTYVKTSC